MRRPLHTGVLRFFVAPQQVRACPYSTTSNGYLTCSVRYAESLSDVVILATGFRQQIPEFLEPIRERVPIEEESFCVGTDYRVSWNGSDANRIYVQNGARKSHGVADSNLSLAAWRSATILNSLLGDELYRLRDEGMATSFLPSLGDLSIHERC